MLGNIERTSGLYLTKTVYAMLLSLAVGVAGVRVPVPAAAPDADRRAHDRDPVVLPGARAEHANGSGRGSCTRVLRFAIPAGSLAAIATFLAYSLVRRTSPASRLVEAQTTAVMVLTWIGLLVLSIVAAPLNRRRLVLVWSMAALFRAGAACCPRRRRSSRWTRRRRPVWLAAFGIAAIVWSFARFFVPGERPIGTRWRAGDD